ncbi:BTB/POZ domain-containing protein [Populus alba x Populus x berolinensis]|uniref:BTB/POZ domain-containing protein n=1 Tax=Populus alba x Populus x berolinensis TaxID=444605 RepID=A0AAD6QPT6_9ROSI|nr:BTB/POZ domain-containing protein [Populus alba x Populus x berolinensis]
MCSRQIEQRKGELSQFIFECEIKRKGNKRLRESRISLLFVKSPLSRRDCATLAFSFFIPVVSLPQEEPSRIGDRSTSDVVVRLRTQEGRDDWFYCHSFILIEKSKYFGDRLSENWPTCQILDSRNCVEVYCEESDFDLHVNFLRLLYVVIDGSLEDIWHGVKNALGILRVAVELGCPQIVNACANYLEAMPWEEAEEDEILKIIPGMGSKAQPILARVQPVNQSAVLRIFLWVGASDKIVLVVEQASSVAEIIETKSKVIEVAAKVLEAIGYGNVILPTAKRFHMVKVWLPFVRVTKPLIDSATTNAKDAPELKIDSELWQSLESTFVSMEREMEVRRECLGEGQQA